MARRKRRTKSGAGTKKAKGIFSGELFSWVKIVALLLALALVLRWTEGERRYEVEGRARVIDGDSLVVDGVEVRLKNIDAPEGRQLCRRNDRDWRCGEEASRRLRSRIGKRVVSCKGSQYDKHDRLLGFCRLGKLQLNQWMVANGWALSFGDYKRQERAAKAARKGVWASQFQRPSEWRRLNMRR